MSEPTSDEDQAGRPASGTPVTASAASRPAGPAARAPRPLFQTSAQRQTAAVWGGVLAGAGFGIALLVVAHTIVLAIEQQYPGMGGMVFWVLIVGGLACGLGIGIMASALIDHDPQPGGSGVPPGATGAAPPGG